MTVKSASYTVGEIFTDQWHGVDFLPDWNGNGPHITVWRGHRAGPGCTGATVDARDALARYSEFFPLAGCEWFVPYVERLAEGGEVTLDEIAQEYARHNEGRELKAARLD